MKLADPVPGNEREIRTVCCYCGTGCGVILSHDGEHITGVRGDPDHPANFGRLCTKGSTLHQVARPAGRALWPAMRAVRDAPRQRLGWDDVLDAAATRFADIIDRHGPDAVAFYVSGQLLTEDYYVFNKLARALIGTNNIDSNSRLCMSSAVAGYKATLGSDSVPASYADLALADHLLIAGANPAWAHPVLFRRIEEAKRDNPALSITVIDPRRTETAEFADHFLQIAPGSDVLLYNAMLHVLWRENLLDDDFIRDHTSGFDVLCAQLVDCTPASVAAACGVEVDEIVAAARRFGRASAALSLWCQGLNQSHHGTANNAALIQLHLATGQIGRPGAGPLSLTGQPNAMGGREVGAMATLLPGHRDLASAADRAGLATLWGVPTLSDRPGLAAQELVAALEAGSVKAVWIACTNPAHSLPDQVRVRAALARAEFVVVQEAFADTETVAFADLLLPAASWGEKSGCVTNSERRVSRVRAALPAPGEARPDWAVAADFARRLAARLGGDAGAFAWPDEAAVFAEHVATTAGRDCDMSGLSHALLDACGPQQWPFPPGSATGAARLFADRRFHTPDGRARFAAVAHPVPHALLPEAVDASHPLVLNTGRLRDHWHGMSRTGRLAALWGHTPRAVLGLNPDDIAARGLCAGALVDIGSRRGSIVLPLVADDSVAPGQAWLPMHWGAASLAGAGANALTAGVCDPVSRQPALKQAAISVHAAVLPWRAAWACREDAETNSPALTALLRSFPYAAIELRGRARPVRVLRVAAAEAPDSALIAHIDMLFGLQEGGDIAHYQDARRGVRKVARIRDDALVALGLVGEVAAFEWLVDAMDEGAPVAPLRPWLFAPCAQRPDAGASVSVRIVCACMGVSDVAIGEAIAAGADLQRLQDGLGCGTRCGSCLPELRRLLVRARDHAPGMLAA